MHYMNCMKESYSLDLHKLLCLFYATVSTADDIINKGIVYNEAITVYMWIYYVGHVLPQH